MKRKTFTILFFIKKTKQLKNGEAPVYLRITVDGLRAEMAVKRSVLSSNWDEKKGRAKQTSTYSRALNQYLESIRQISLISKSKKKLFTTLSCSI